MSKTKDNSEGARREYTRMREEMAIKNRQSTSTAVCFEYNGEDESNRKGQSIFAVDETIKRQHAQPEVTSFPFTDNEANTEDLKMEDKDGRSGYTHGANLSMLSAIVHMKCMANRLRAKNNREKGNNALTTLDEYGRVQPAQLNTDADTDPWGHLRKCRYLRGVADDKELTISEIFK